jgi:Domain of unknown function (DUF4118)
MAAGMSRERLAVQAGLAAPLELTVMLVPFRAGFPNTDATLALILVVAAVAANGYRLAGVAAVSAAARFDFSLTMPYERFTITRRTDIETTVLLLAIGVAVTEIAVWGRRQHETAVRRAGYLEGINTAARPVATGGSAAALTVQVSGLLSLVGCRFQDGIAGTGSPARLLRNGTIVSGGRICDVEWESLPPGRDIELLAEAGSLLQRRFLLTPGPGTRPTVEERLVAVALADQAGAALSGAQLAGHHR